MRKLAMRFVVMISFIVLGVSFLVSCENKDESSLSWPSKQVTVICPWAVGGVADMVNRKAATFGEAYLGVPVLATNELGAGGNVALTNYLKQKPNSETLIFGAEGAFSIAQNIEGSDILKFTYDDYVPVINLYSAIFVLTSDKKLGISTLEDLQVYGKGKRVKVAVNGIAGSEAFLAKALFKELGLELELVSYNGANLALDAASKGETAFAISHQSQVKGSVEAGILQPVVVFDEKGINNEVFQEVKGVGEYGYSAYFRNRCFLLARKGTDPEVIDTIRSAYLQILEEPEMINLYKSLMIEVDPLDLDSMNAHINDVAQIVRDNK